MTKETIEKIMGKNFLFNGGSFGYSGIRGTVLSVEENWIEVQTKKGVRFVNADFLIDMTSIVSK